MGCPAQLWVLEGLQGSEGSASPSPEPRPLWFCRASLPAPIVGVCLAGLLLPGEQLPEGSWCGAGLTWKPSFLRAASNHPLLLCKNQQQQKKPFLAPALSHLALIRGRMFLCGHRGVTEALGNRNPLPLSHSKDCSVLTRRGWGPSSGTGDPLQGLHEAVTAHHPSPAPFSLGLQAAGAQARWLRRGSWRDAGSQLLVGTRA